MIVGVVNNKGGVGKTTTATILAELAALKDMSVGVFDLCGQQNCFSNLSEGGVPVWTQIAVIASANKTPKQKDLEQYDFAVIDTPPTTESTVIRNVIQMADALVIPFFLKKHAVTGLQETIALAEQAGDKAIVGVALEDLSKKESTVHKRWLEESRKILKARTMIEVPMFLRVEKNLEDQELFYRGLKDSEYAIYDALFEAIMKEVKQ